MGYSIRTGTSQDVEAIVTLSLLAWEPVFTSFACVLGPAIYALRYPDWVQSQNAGIGTALNLAAIQAMKAAGMRLAVVGMGGDPGHAPARRSYEKASFTPLPQVRYYQDLTS